ncbi:hypothetical protein PhCBS80983_g00019 [Powellomyces hirtus]|uniref:Tyrosinase copper-binding domain-containing protein n=1 Tax=Powellomyces hirtus TaxID=109895 RepID=A0A507EFD5_9FUNG|nr:hypothetical protein PhCBS80983_g00019 [Powellomyces hirtus]
MKFSTLLTASAFAALAFSGQGVDAAGFGDYSACRSTIVRKEIHDLTRDEWMTYMTTIQKAMVTPHPTKPSITIWERFAEVHNQYNAQIHANSAFVIWHRWFTYYAERELRKLNPAFVFPYWATERQYAANDWAKDGFWAIQGAGTGFGKDISGGAWAGVKYTVTNNRPEWWLRPFKNAHIRRAYNLNDVKNAKSKSQLTQWRFASLDDYNNIYQTCLKRATDGFHCWANRNEWLHGTFHVINGGNDDQVGQIGTMFSPLDPLFFIHHANIDRIYDNVQAAWTAAKKPQSWQINGSCPTNLERPRESDSPKCLTLQTKLPGFALTVNDVQFSAQLCVKYAAPVRVPSSNQPKLKKRDEMDGLAPANAAKYTAVEQTQSATATATATETPEETATATSTPCATPTETVAPIVVLPPMNTTLPTLNETLPIINGTLPTNGTNATDMYPPGYTPPTYPAAPLPEWWIKMQYKAAPAADDEYVAAIAQNINQIFNSTVTKISRGEIIKGPIEHYSQQVEDVAEEVKHAMEEVGQKVVDALEHGGDWFENVIKFVKENKPKTKKKCHPKKHY